ncbi:YggS family pyridoxal phosphate-dependent enzyme [Thiocapsa sp.]|uniref:YggS family pyridoxal phosphate-dependent enzyme n=1 Tax=Thiocapsa sp. TaxID=2024551 RepID=UPI0025F64BFA|nr:YggS family pyridoxal phosphate-dependent enzyme [Thiocapsa sp.]
MEPYEAIGNDGIQERLLEVQARIRAAVERAQRPPDSVALLAVSKTHGAEAVRAAYAAGQRAFGESYVQEAIEKIALLADLPDIEWHFIGRIQANKTRQIAARFDWVHGLSDSAHARRLSEQRPSNLPPLKVCIQVNVSGETSKGGVEPEAVAALIATCEALPGLVVRGLMTLPAPAEDEDAQRKPFRGLRLLRDRLATANRPLACLSMGMSDDLEAAILEGATLVRVGTAVFGPRPYNAG